MERMLLIATSATLATLASPALACAEPSLDWYHQNSAAVIDGDAQCDAERRSCKVRVTKVVKNDGYALSRGRTLTLDYVEFKPIAITETQIVYACGDPLFEPQFARFSGRFYLDVDRGTGEAIVRRHRIRAPDGELWREDFCVGDDGEFRCSYN